MSKQAKELCLNCGKRPPTSGVGTVPLCSVCQQLAQGSERGVKFEKPRIKHA
jgi:hypothetical protein